MITFLHAAYRRILRAAFPLLHLLGLNVILRSDYYSPLPLASRLTQRKERWNRPSEMVGIELDLEQMKEELNRLVARHGDESELPDYGHAKTLGYGQGFSEVDAFVLYLMIRDLKPSHYIEVGAGLSTFIVWTAAQVNRRGGSPCEMICIDPYADSRLEELAGLTVKRRPVQDVALDLYDRLEAHDVLFIDSTHVVKIDGDVPHVYLEVLPRLHPGVVIHSHDIHFPFNVPHPAEQYVCDAKWPRFWTEAMLLQAFLSFNPSYRITLSTPLLRHRDDDFLARTLPEYRPLQPADYDTHHGSLWYRKVDTDAQA